MTSRKESGEGNADIPENIASKRRERSPVMPCVAPAARKGTASGATTPLGGSTTFCVGHTPKMRLMTLGPRPNAWTLSQPVASRLFAAPPLDPSEPTPTLEPPPAPLDLLDLLDPPAPPAPPDSSAERAIVLMSAPAFGNAIVQPLSTSFRRSESQSFAASTPMPG